MKIELFGWRLYAELSLRQTARVSGIDSDIIDDDRHILLWDFDHEPLDLIIPELERIQKLWALPEIKIMRSSFKRNKNGKYTSVNYHAICIKALQYPLMLQILASTKYLDQTYFKLGVVRGYHTLRITPKRNRFETMIVHVHTINSNVSADAWALDRLNVSNYLTEIK